MDFQLFDGISFPRKIFPTDQTPNNDFLVDKILLEKDDRHVRETYIIFLLMYWWIFIGIKKSEEF